MIYAIAIILLAVLALAALIKKWIDESRARSAYEADKTAMEAAIRNGDYPAIQFYSARVRKYEATH